MSDALYSTRLRWNAGRGVAKLYGRALVLEVAPDLGAGPVEMIDYTPEIRCVEIRQMACDPVREMTRDEIHAADRLLRSLFGG